MKLRPSARAAVAASGNAATSSVTLTAVVTTVGTALAAFQLFQPKLAIARAIKRETGAVDNGFSWFYSVPQYIALAGVLVVWTILLFAVVHQMAPSSVPTYPWLQPVLALLALENLVPVLLAAAVMAGFIQLNILSWIFLLVGRLLSWLPFASGAFGAEGRSAGWIQAWCICSAWDKGQPLLISDEQVERLGDELLRRISISNFDGPDFAPKPANATREAAANIALMGGILEEAHDVHRWDKPASFKDFYAALADIRDANRMFEPNELMKYPSGESFAEVLRTELAKRMEAKEQPVPPGNYFAAASYIVKTWTLLHATDGSVLKKLPWYASAIGSKLYWLNRRLADFPLLRGGGMREQIIKLMTRWGATPWAKREGFFHPFSRSQAWLLLQEGVLTTFPEQKDVTFWASGDVGISKIACNRLYERVHRTAGNRESEIARNVSDRFPDYWDLTAAADFTLWSWAHEQSKEGLTKGWKGWRWKIENGRASKV